MIKNIIRGFKKLRLKIQIKRCELRLIELETIIDIYHETILKTIEDGNKVKVRRLELERDEYVEITINTIHKKYKLKRSLIWA